MLILGKYFFRYRGILPVPWVMGSWYLMATTMQVVLSGLGIAAIGVILRLLAISSIGQKARTLEDKVGDLTVEGWYLWCRNPLYVANILIWMGVFSSCGNWWLLLAGGSYFIFQYWCIVLWEESILMMRKKDSYIAYMIHTPRWFSGSFPAQLWGSISFSKVLRYERSTFLSFVIVYVPIFYQII